VPGTEEPVGSSTVESTAVVVSVAASAESPLGSALGSATSPTSLAALVAGPMPLSVTVDIAARSGRLSAVSASSSSSESSSGSPLSWGAIGQTSVSCRLVVVLSTTGDRSTARRRVVNRG
jgi:hypothetical protein